MDDAKLSPQTIAYRSRVEAAGVNPVIADGLAEVHRLAGENAAEYVRDIMLEGQSNRQLDEAECSVASKWLGTLQGDVVAQKI